MHFLKRKREDEEVVSAVEERLMETTMESVGEAVEDHVKEVETDQVGRGSGSRRTLGGGSK